MILAIVLGALIGIALGAFGAGASILAVPVLVHLAGQSMGSATSTSLVAVGAASAVAAVGHARAHRVNWRTAAMFVVLGVPGTWLGTRANTHLEPNVLLLAFSILVLLAAHRMLTACPTCTRVGEEHALQTTGQAGASKRTLVSVAKVGAAATIVGLLAGLFGVGGGFVIIPALALALKLPMPTAIGTSLAIIVGNATVALSIRGIQAVHWTIAAPFTLTMLIGSAIGLALASRLPAQQSLRLFAGLLIAVALGNGVLAATELWT